MPKTRYPRKKAYRRDRLVRPLFLEALEPRRLLAGNGLVMSGRLTYELPASRYANGIVLPLPIAGAEVLVTVPAEGVFPTAETTAPVYTDTNGNFTVEFPDTIQERLRLTQASAATLTIVAYGAGLSADGLEYNVAPYAVVPSQGAKPFEDPITLGAGSTLPWFSPGSVSITDNVTISPSATVPNSAPPFPTVPDRPVTYADVFDIFSALTTAQRYYEYLASNSLAPASQQELTLIYDPNSGDTGYDSPNMPNPKVTAPTISFGAPTANDYLYTWDWVDHEYGHYVADMSDFNNLGAGGEHALDSNSNDELAFNEGWADYYAVASQTWAGDQALGLFGVGDTKIADFQDLSKPNNANTNNSLATGENAEASVSGIFWQLSQSAEFMAWSDNDDAVPGDVDLYNLLSQNNFATNNHILTLPQLWNVLLPDGAQGYSDFSDAFSTIFELNGVSPDNLAVNGNNASPAVTSGVPVFSFEVPVINASSTAPGVQFPAYYNFQINYYSDQFGYIASTTASLLPPNADGTWSSTDVAKAYNAFADVSVTVWTFTPTISFWNSVIGSGTNAIRWNVEALSSTFGNNGRDSAYTPSGFMSYTRELTGSNVALAQLSFGDWVNLDANNNPYSLTLDAEVSTSSTSAQVAQVNFYQATSDGPPELIGYSTTDNESDEGTPGYSIDLPWSQSYAYAVGTFWAVAVDADGNPISTWSQDGSYSVTGEGYGDSENGLVIGEYSTGSDVTLSVNTEHLDDLLQPGNAVESVTFYYGYSDVDFGSEVSSDINQSPGFTLPMTVGPNPVTATPLETVSPDANGLSSITIDTSQYDPSAIWVVANLASGNQTEWTNSWGLNTYAAIANVYFTGPSGTTSVYTPGQSVQVSVWGGESSENSLLESVLVYSYPYGEAFDPSTMSPAAVLTSANGWTASIATSTSGGPLAFAEVPIDVFGKQGTTSYDELLMNPASYAVTSIEASSVYVAPGSAFDLTATVNSVDGLSSFVTFYEEIDGAESLASPQVGIAGEVDGQYTVTVDSSDPWDPGQSVTFFAVANNWGYIYQTPLSPTVTVTFGAISDSYDASDGTVALSAGGSVEYNGPATNVAFYRDDAFSGIFDPAADTLLGMGTPDGNGNWNLTVPASELSNGQDVFAIYSDSDGIEVAASQLTYESPALPGPTVLYFDPQENTGYLVEDYGIGLGGAGTWDTTTADWYDPATDSLVAWGADGNAAGDVAVFEGTAGIVTVSPSISAKAITFAVDGYELQPASGGGSLALANGATISVVGGATAIIGTPMVGDPAEISETGSGELILDGTTDVGTIAVSGALSLDRATNAVVSLNGGILDLNGNNASIGGLSGSSGLVTNFGAWAANLAVTGSDGATFGGTIDDGTATVSLTVEGDVALSGTNGYSGGTIVQGGTLSINSDLAIGELPIIPTADIELSDGILQFTTDTTLSADRTIVAYGEATFDTDGNNVTVLGNIDTASGGWAELAVTDSSGTGNGSLELSGSDSYSAGTTVYAGTLRLGSASALPAGAGLNVYGTLDLNGQNPTIGGLSGNGLISDWGSAPSILTIADGSGVCEFDGLILDGGSAPVGLAKSGAGGLILTNANEYSGGTTINGGTIYSQNPSSLGYGGLVVNDGGTLDLDGNDLVLYGALQGESGGAITNSASNSAATLWLGQSTSSLFAGTIGSGYGGPVSSGPIALALVGGGDLTLLGSNTYTGGTTIYSGTLSINSDAALGAVPNEATTNIVFASGGTLQFLSSFALSANRTIQIEDGAIGTLDTNGNYVVYAGAITGNGELDMTDSSPGDAGILTLSGDNTFTGPAVIWAGTSQLGSSTALDNDTVLVINGGTLDLNGYNATVAELSGSGGYVINTSANSATITVGSDNATTEFDGTIEETRGSLILEKVGNGQLAAHLVDAVLDLEHGSFELL